MTPKPDAPPGIVLGGAAKPAVRRAARLADGWMAPSSLSVEGVGRRVEDIRRVREAEGVDGDFTVYVLRHGFVGDTPEAAWETIREGRRYLARTYAGWAAGDPVDELPAERVRELRESAVLGPPERIVEALEPYREAVGDDVHVILRTYYPGVDTDAMVECVERLGDEVAPRL